MRPAPLLGLLLWALPLPVRGLRRSDRHDVHWNGSNPRFLRDDYTIQVAIDDYLDIYCPHYEGAVPAGRAETFALFIVDWEGYRGCYETPGAVKRWECNRPQSPFGPVRFSEKIQRFTPFSLGFEFQPGETYYYISVPSPESPGRCLKLRVYVCCRDTTPEPVTEVPNSQPRGRGGPEGEYGVGREVAGGRGWAHPHLCSCPGRRGACPGCRGPAAAPRPVPGACAPHPAPDLTPGAARGGETGSSAPLPTSRLLLCRHPHPTEPMGQPRATTHLLDPCGAEPGPGAPG
uniref:Ephrin-A4 n=1 Tax=Calidris pygmaea TaxID=425635 RepID=A0A8C3PNZ6_9CHAR